MRSTVIGEPAGGRAKWIDASLAVLLLALLAPLLAVIFCLLRLEGSPGLTRERRWSRTGRRFLGWRFRTTAPRRASLLCRGWLSPAVPRPGTVGRFISVAGLADLPELANVVRGDLSLAEALAHLPPN